MIGKAGKFLGEKTHNLFSHKENYFQGIKLDKKLSCLLPISQIFYWYEKQSNNSKFPVKSSFSPTHKTGNVDVIGNFPIFAVSFSFYTMWC